MVLGKNNLKVIEVLRDKNLSHLVEPFKKMVELDKLGNIKIHKMTWKVIMRDIYNPMSKRLDIENMIVSYLVNFGLAYVPPKKQKSTVSKDRVRKHRAMKKELGYKTISIELSPDNYEKMKRYKVLNKLTYNDLIDKLLNGKNSLKHT